LNVTDTPVLELSGVSKSFGAVQALYEVDFHVAPGQVMALVGDNGAGKSTLIQVLAGVHQPSAGRYLLDGAPVEFTSPRSARAVGIATVYQDLALIPLLSIWRNFFLGSEPSVGRGPFRRIDVTRCEQVARREVARLGVDLRDTAQPVGTLSGGERQVVAIARALHFGARVLVLDEPTAALGVRQAETVLQSVARARDQGLGVVFVTHNPRHAQRVGDRFVVLRRGEVLGDFAGKDVGLEELSNLMAGGAESASVPTKNL
jgi:simple sugar transport system ATP-binding protein